MLRILKRIVFIFIGLICLSLGWYGLQRGFAGARQIQITDLGELHIPAIERNSNYEALRVGAYNIAHGRGGKLGESNWSSAVREDEEEHLSKLVAQIVSTDLDVLILNEVDFDANWSGRRNQALFIAEKAGFQHVAQLTNIDIVLPFFKLQFGNAILSKKPFKDVQAIELPPVKKWEVLLAGRKDALEATIEWRRKDIGIIAVHIETRDKDVRMGSVNIFQERIDKSDTSYILLGDFNSQRSKTGKPDTAVEKLITAGFQTDAQTKTWNTFPSQSPNRGIDWILTNTPLVTINTQAIPSNLSDT